ncbi:MAG: HlyD family type I secretion periplasmic adaptor subunit [Paracoccaceae bacterium]
MTGDLRARLRPPLLAGALALILFAAGFLGWAALVPISGAVIAAGQVEVEQNRQVVQHPDGGRIAAILVAEGDRVAAGQILLRLDTTDDRAALTLAEGQLARLLAEAARLRAERDGASAPVFPPDLATLVARQPALTDLVAQEQALFQARRAARTAERSALTLRGRDARAEIAALGAQAAALDRQRRLLTEDLDRQAALLAQGLAEGGRVSAIKADLAHIDGLAAGVDASRAQAQGRIDEADLQALNLDRVARDQALARLADIDPALADLADRTARLRHRIAAADLRAPLDGTVLGLRFTSVSAVVLPAEPILDILPAGRPLVVEVRIAPADIDQVAIGQTASLRIATFDSRTTPDITGRVTRLSPDTMADGTSGPAFYRAEIELPAAEARRAGPEPLVPGMPVEVFLETGHRTALAILTEPLTRYFRQAFRAG